VSTALPDGYTDLPAGKLANVVTCLEMHARPAVRNDPPGVAASLIRMPEPDVTWYRKLFVRVGAEYLWFSRLALSDAELAAVTCDPKIEVYAVREDGEDAGLLELDFRVAGECEIVFFAMVDSHIGRGTGRWLMNRAIERAWSQPIRRLWVHTCSLDHPGAVSFYVRSGFKPYKRQIEISDDPRLCGLLPLECAPAVPLI
jgi:GNAT superfamily N-acetyltransferase